MIKQCGRVVQYKLFFHKLTHTSLAEDSSLVFLKGHQKWSLVTGKVLGRSGKGLERSLVGLVKDWKGPW